MRENLHKFIQKLVHPLIEVRIRSATTLQEKLEVGICAVEDLVQNENFVLNVISLLQSDSTLLKVHGINLLQFILLDPVGKITFESLGGKQMLYELKSSMPTHQERKVDFLLEKLNSKNGIQTTQITSNVSDDRAIDKDNFTMDSTTLGVHINSYEDEANTNSILDDSCVSAKDLEHTVSSPILFTSFPWLPLTNIDLQILNSTGQVLVQSSDTELMAMLQLCHSTLFKDFPIEVFLQRPFILKVLLGYLVADSTQAKDDWRLQERVCHTLSIFSHSLLSKLQSYNGNFPICELPSVETLHESDDSSEFMVLKLHQLTMLDWCCQLLNPAFALFCKSQPRLSSAILRLSTLTMHILYTCVHPQALWASAMNKLQEPTESIVRRTTSSLLQSLRILSNMLMQAYEEVKLPLSRREAEVMWTKIRTISRAFIRWIHLFASADGFIEVFGRVEVEAFQYLLSDPCFYMEYPKDYALILSKLRYVEEELFLQVCALVEAKDRLEDTRLLLQISSCQVDEFLAKAASSLPLLFLHRSRVLVEKVVRGLAKQSALNSTSPLQISEGCHLLLQLLSEHDDESRLLGYNALKNLVVESVGISQASQPSQNRSLKILLVLHPRVLNHLVYSGCTDTNPQVAEATRMVLLSLLRGQHLMMEEVLCVAMGCFFDCLLNLQNLAEMDSSLGRAVLNLPYDLSRRKNDQDMNLMRVKFLLKCLLSREASVRQEVFRDCLALLITSSSSYIHIPTAEVVVERDSDLLVINTSVELMASSPVDALDRNSLEKVLNVISSASTEPAITQMAWTQLTIILQNPALHSLLEALWPLPDFLRDFFSMMKVVGERGLTVALVPSALTILRLRASFSASIRSTLATDPQVLLLILRAVLFFRTDDAVRLDASLLLSLLLNEEVLVQRTTNSGRCFGSLSLPSLVVASQHVAFKHTEYLWPVESPNNPRMKTLRSMTTRDQDLSNLLPVDPLQFARIAWVVMCADGWKAILGQDFDFATPLSTRFVMSGDEAASLPVRLILPHAAGFLREAQNATSHRAVKRSANHLQSLLVAIDDDGDVLQDVFLLEGWTEGFARFLLTSPSTGADKQVLFHTLNLVADALGLVLKQRRGSCIFCPMISLVVAEFTKPESSLSLLLKETGTQDLMPSTEEAFQSAQLLESLLRILSLLFQLSTQRECGCHPFFSAPWSKLAANVTSLLTLILRKCQTLQDYNLNALVPTLDCFVHLAKNQSIGERSLQLIPILINLLMCFHTGRGRAHNAFLGRAVSIRALLIMAFVLSEVNIETLEQVMNIIREEIDSLPWLLAALEHSDPAIMTAGLKVSIALSLTPNGARLLDEAFSPVPGGIWVLAFRYFMRPDMTIPVYVSSVQLLLNVSSHAGNLPEMEKRWLSLSRNDTLPGFTATKKDALIEILKKFGILKRVRQIIEALNPLVNGEQVPFLPHMYMNEEMKEFVSSEESQWATMDYIEDESTDVPDPVDSPDLVAGSLLLLVNLVQLNGKSMIEALRSSGVAKTIVRHFALLSEDVKESSKWNEVFQAGFQLLQAMGNPFSSNTHLTPLALNILSLGDLKNSTLAEECFRFLSVALINGGWGSVRVLELLRSDPLPVLCGLVRLLHETSPANEMASGIAFIGCLCKATDEGTPEVYAASLQDLLDSPLHIHPGSKKAVCPGWEMSRHLIQLLPSTMAATLSHCYSLQPNVHQGHLKLVLEALKLLLLISRSARRCAYFLHSPLLKLLSFSLTQLHSNILNLNIHITASLMNKKELTPDFLFAIHCLHVATNWLADPSNAPKESGNSGGEEGEDNDDAHFCPSVVGECLIPLLHPLWVPALRAPPFTEALVHFLIVASSHFEVCSILTRTSILPGASLSSSRTRNSILVSITTSVVRLLERRKSAVLRCKDDCVPLPTALLDDALELLINCGRLHQAAYVIVKEGFLKTIFTFLENLKELGDPVVQRLIQCLTILTLQKEARAALLKVPSWIKCLKVCLKENSLKKNVLLTFTNMISNVQVVKNMLSTENFVMLMISILRDASQDLTRGTRILVDTEVVHICLVVLWCLSANNQRCKAILKRLNLLPHLDNFIHHRDHPRFCLRLAEIINS